MKNKASWHDDEIDFRPEPGLCKRLFSRVRLTFARTGEAVKRLTRRTYDLVLRDATSETLLGLAVLLALVSPWLGARFAFASIALSAGVIAVRVLFLNRWVAVITHRFGRIYESVDEIRRAETATVKKPTQTEMEPVTKYKM